MQEIVSNKRWILFWGFKNDKRSFSDFNIFLTHTEIAEAIKSFIFLAHNSPKITAIKKVV